MDSESVRLPDKLSTKIEQAANERGISKSEKIRSDLMQIYFED